MFYFVYEQCGQLKINASSKGQDGVPGTKRIGTPPWLDVPLTTLRDAVEKTKLAKKISVFNIVTRQRRQQMRIAAS
jgi:hypothetical protein